MQSRTINESHVAFPTPCCVYPEHAVAAVKGIIDVLKHVGSGLAKQGAPRLAAGDGQGAIPRRPCLKPPWMRFPVIGPTKAPLVMVSAGWLINIAVAEWAICCSTTTRSPHRARLPGDEIASFDLNAYGAGATHTRTLLTVADNT